MSKRLDADPVGAVDPSALLLALKPHRGPVLGHAREDANANGSFRRAQVGICFAGGAAFRGGSHLLGRSRPGRPERDGRHREVLEWGTAGG